MLISMNTIEITEFGSMIDFEIKKREFEPVGYLDNGTLATWNRNERLIVNWVHSLNATIILGMTFLSQNNKCQVRCS